MRLKTPKIKQLSKREIDRLRFQDFLGELLPEEIPLAKQCGVYKYDSWAKERREKLQKLDKNS